MPIDMRQLAEQGARARLADLQQEIDEILRAFPALRAGRRSASARGRGRQAASPSDGTTSARRRRKPMTAAQRKAVGERMRKYWAARRKAQKSS